MDLCKRCNKNEASSKKAKYCGECRSVIASESMARREARKREDKKAGVSNGGKIDSKWLVRGTISTDKGSGSIVNG
jgi:hypothetical protein